MLQAWRANTLMQLIIDKRNTINTEDAEWSLLSSN